MVYVVGTTITATVTISPLYDATTAVTVLLRKPDGTTATPTATALDVDHRQWAVSWIPTLAGQYVLVPTVTGLGAGVGVPQTFDVQAVPPPDSGYSYATTTDFANFWPGQAAPTGLANLLRFASIDIDQTLVASIYDITDPAVVAVLRDACSCWAGELEAAFPGQAGTLSASGAFASVAIGSVSLSRGSGGPGQQSYTVGRGVARSSRAYGILARAGLVGGDGPTAGLGFYFPSGP